MRHGPPRGPPTPSAFPSPSRLRFPPALPGNRRRMARSPPRTPLESPPRRQQRPASSSTAVRPALFIKGILFKSTCGQSRNEWKKSKMPYLSSTIGEMIIFVVWEKHYGWRKEKVRQNDVRAPWTRGTSRKRADHSKWDKYRANDHPPRSKN